MTLPCEFEAPTGPRFGIVVLRTDETLEGDLRRLLPVEARVHVTRVENADEVDPETLSAMAGRLVASARLLPGGRYDAVAYGCTSASGVIGSDRVADLVREGARTAFVTDPLAALVAECERTGVRRLGFVSPYVESVSDRLRARLEAAGMSVPHLASFGVSDDPSVVRIAPRSVESAAREMAARDVEAVFLSCTNLRTLEAIERLDVAVPVWSSNLLLARALMRSVGGRERALRPMDG